MPKYAIATDGLDYARLEPDGFSYFCALAEAPLFNSQSEALRALQVFCIHRGLEFFARLRLVRIDEVVHVGETQEVRRSYCAPVTDVTISTRYEINPHCLSLGRDFRYKADTANGVFLVLTEPAYREICCGDFIVEAIDTVQLPPYTTRVASELK